MTAGYIIATTDTGSLTVAAGIEFATTPENERIFVARTCIMGSLDARIVLMEAFHHVGTGENDGGIAQTGDTCPWTTAAIGAIDGYILQTDYGIIGNRDLIIAVEISVFATTVMALTLQVALLPPADAVMTALPGLRTVTTPEELTVATDSSLDDQ